ncbi:MAG TPA: hypothetical protein PLD46_01630 [Hyphomicrobium sp.]|nr:hypothetical protein [Hyphomicrobium sp.]
MEEFALFLESNPVAWQMAKFKILRRANMIFQPAIEVCLRAADISDAEPAKVIDVADGIGTRTTLENFVVHDIGGQDIGTLKSGICWLRPHA